MDTGTVIGVLAALLTTLSNFFQLKKCWDTQSAGDLSLKMFGVLTGGVALWTAYGVVKEDILIIGANAVSLLPLAGILFFKLRSDNA